MIESLERFAEKRSTTGTCSASRSAGASIIAAEGDNLVANSADPHRPALTKRWTWLIILCLVSASSIIDRSILVVALEQIKAEFNVSDATLGALTGLAFGLVYALFGLPIARWADRGDRRLIVSLAVAVWSLATIACGLAASIAQLFVARIAVGIGEAGGGPPSQSLIADYFPQTERARALGVYLFSSIFASVLVFAVGGYVVDTYGWRATMIMVGAPGLLLAFLVWRFVREPRQSQTEQPTSEPFWAALKRLAEKRSFVALVVAYTIYSAVGGIFSFNVSFFIRVHGLTLSEAGALLGMITGVGAVVGSLGGSALVDRIAAGRPSRYATTPAWGYLSTTPLLILAYWADATIVATALLIICNIIMLAVAPALFSALHSVCGSPRRATAVAVMGLCTSLIGAAFGPVLAGILSDAFAIEFGPADGLRYALMTGACLFLPAGLCVLVAGRWMEADQEA